MVLKRGLDSGQSAVIVSRVVFSTLIYINMAGRGAKSGKKAAKTYERPGLSDEEIEEIKEAFNLFDTDGSGTFR